MGWIYSVIAGSVWLLQMMAKTANDGDPALPSPLNNSKQPMHTNPAHFTATLVWRCMQFFIFSKHFFFNFFPIIFLYLIFLISIIKKFSVP